MRQRRIGSLSRVASRAYERDRALQKRIELTRLLELNRVMAEEEAKQAPATPKKAAAKKPKKAARTGEAAGGSVFTCGSFGHVNTRKRSGEVMKPSYDEETLAAYFQPVSGALFEDPILGRVLRELEQSDSDVIAAVTDVDRSQIRDFLALSPFERLEQATALSAYLEGFHGGS